MQTTRKETATTATIDWQKLMSLSRDDKRTVIARLEESMIEPEPFEEAIKRAVSVEEFRRLCHEELDKIYGEK